MNQMTVKDFHRLRAFLFFHNLKLAEISVVSLIETSSTLKFYLQIGAIANHNFVKHPLFPRILHNHTLFTVTVIGIPLNSHLRVQITVRKDSMVIDTATVKGIQFRAADLLSKKQKKPSFWKYRSWISLLSTGHAENGAEIFEKWVNADPNFNLTSTCDIIYCC